MEPLPFPAYLDHIRTESARFREVLADCDPQARVPACPDWDAADLLWHLTTVQAFWAKVVSTRPEPADEADEGRLDRPETYDALLAAFDEHSAALVDALAAADPAEEAWHWSSDHTVGASYRRQAHEALIHRLDAEETAGRVTDLDPTLAADGVLEALTVMYGGCPPWGTITPTDRVLAIRVSDTGDDLRVALARFTGTDPRRQDLRRARHRPARRRLRRRAAGDDHGHGGGPRHLALAPRPGPRAADLRRRRGRAGRAEGHPQPAAQLSQAQRWTAPHRSAASATAASRAAPASASVSVRSGARKRSAKASDLRPSPTWAPV